MWKTSSVTGIRPCFQETAIAVAAFSGGHTDENTAWVLFSYADGRSWGGARLVGERDYNEAPLLPHWARGNCWTREPHARGKPYRDLRFRRLRIDQETPGAGDTTRRPHSNLIRLQDGSILLT